MIIMVAFGKFNFKKRLQETALVVHLPSSLMFPFLRRLLILRSPFEANQNSVLKGNALCADTNLISL